MGGCLKCALWVYSCCLGVFESKVLRSVHRRLTISRLLCVQVACGFVMGSVVLRLKAVLWFGVKVKGFRFRFFFFLS